jgi:allantoinase
MRFDCLIRGGQLILPHDVVSADVGIAEGAIVAVEPGLSGTAREEIDATGLHVFPGVVDVHVHFNEPGRTEWEGAATGSLALAAGGGVCFCDMPLNSSPPTIDGKSFDQKRAALETESIVDFGLWGGLVPGNHGHLAELAERGVIGFKAFMCDSGIEDFPRVNEDELGRGMEMAARLGLPVAVHAEDEAITQSLSRAATASGRTSIRDYLDSRPIRAEVAAIQRAILLTEHTGCALHIVHVSSVEGVRAVVAARSKGLDVTCETCPHYLVFNDGDVEQVGPAAKCSPPIRSASQREALWAAVKSCDIDFVASDHSPAPWSMKQSSNFFRVWGGIAGCQTMLGALIEEGHVRRSLSLSRIAELIARVPAARFKLGRKGEIAVGADADLALIDLSKPCVVCADHLHYRHRISPFIGRTMSTSVRRTLVRGQTVFADGVGTDIRGRFVRPRGQASAARTDQ